MLEFSIITISTFVTILVSTTRYIATACFKKDISKVLPLFAIAYGIVLGIAGYYTPDIEMGKNLVEAIFIGISTGAAATGFNQVGKQLYKNTLNPAEAVIKDPELVNVRQDMDINITIPEPDASESEDDENK